MSAKNNNNSSSQENSSKQKRGDSNEEDDMVDLDVVEEELVAEAVIVPPDGGWGWVIVAASFLTNAVVDGIIFTAGQGFLPLWEKEFTAGSAGMAAWVVSLLSGCYLLVGPIVSAVANIFGCRITAMIGAVMAAAGFLLSMYAQSIWYLYLSFGILGGVGLGFIYLPSIVIVSYYFEKKRALATGIAVCGSGIGTFVFAPLIRFLLAHFSWQQTMLIMSGIILQCILFAAFYKKLSPTKQQMSKLNEKLHEYGDEVVQNEKKMSMMSQDRPQSYYGTETEKAPENGFIHKDVEFERFNNNGTTPGFKKDLLRQPMSSKRRALSTGQRVFRSTMDLSLYRKQTHVAAEGQPSHELLRPLTQGQQQQPGGPDIYNEVSKRSITVLNRPLSRMDIFYSGSVKNLPQYKSVQDVRHFLASTVSIPQAAAAAAVACEEVDACRDTGASVAVLEPESAKKGVQGALKSMLDFSLFGSPTFIVLALSGFFTLTGFFVPFIYLPKMAESFGHSGDKATFLVSVLGVTNIVARILCGWISDRPQANALMINNAALIAAGLATAIVPHCRSYFMLCFYCVIFGMGTACFASLRSVICVELLGLEKLTNAYGLLLLFMGIASLVGSPLAGFLFDQTKSFNVSFYFMGAMVAFSGILGLPLPYINRWEKRRQFAREEKAQDEAGQELLDMSSSTKKAVKNGSTGKAPAIVVHSPKDELPEKSITDITEALKEEEEDNYNTHTSTSSKITAKNGGAALQQ